MRLAPAIAALVLVFSGTARGQAPATAARIGPAFDCRQQSDALSRVTCSDAELSALHLAFNQAFLALRHQRGRAEERALVEEAARLQATMLRRCNINIHAADPAAQGGGDRERLRLCVRDAYAEQRDHWRARATGAAAEEAARDPADHIQAQRDLQRLGLLPAQVPADGVYRAQTRTAIAAFQARNGRAATGLLGDADAALLRAAAAAPPPPATAPPAPPPVPPNMPARRSENGAPLPPAAPAGAPTTLGGLEAPMRFVYVQAELPELNLAPQPVILAQGTILPDTDAGLRTLLATYQVPPGTLVVLASPGGNLRGAVALGRLIRSSGLSTVIGRSDGGSGIVTRDVRCFSACTLAYIGGVRRLFAANSHFGVHQFWTEAEITAEAAIAASQRVTAQLVEYVREMGIDPSLISEASRAGPETMNLLSPTRLAELGIITGAGASPWQAATMGGRRALLASAWDLTGQHALALACLTGAEPALVAILRPADPGWREYAARWPLRFTANGQPVEIYASEFLGPPQSTGQSVQFALRLTPRLRTVLLGAHNIALRRVAPDGSAAIGFDLDMAPGRDAVATFLRACPAR